MNEATLQPTDDGRRQTWYAEANPDLGYDGGDPAEEPPPVDPDKDHPGDPPGPRADLSYDDPEPATEKPPVDKDTDHPGDPPSAEVARNNGR